MLAKSLRIVDCLPNLEPLFNKRFLNSIQKSLMRIKMELQTMMMTVTTHLKVNRSTQTDAVTVSVTMTMMVSRMQMINAKVTMIQSM